MHRVSLIMTIIGPDRPGLVDSVASTVESFDGNWEESRMLRLSGQFAGLCRVTCPTERLDELKTALKALEKTGISSTLVMDEEKSSTPETQRMHLNLLGLDRPGLLKTLTTSLSHHGINVEELKTECRCAPSSGEMLFEADVVVQVGPHSDLDQLREDMEATGQELMVEIQVDHNSTMG